MRVAGLDHPQNSDLLAVRQVTVSESKHERRAEVALLVKGLPLVVIEVKNPADKHATIWLALKSQQARGPSDWRRCWVG